ncbi:MAG: hypothetical protein ACTSX6_00920 [Candidatus Heimdallarchaeaceae archaeon]
MKEAVAQKLYITNIFLFHVYSTIVLHANLQYAEIPPNEIPLVIEKSYIPVLRTLLGIPKLQAVLNFTGVTLEILFHQNQEAIELLREGIEKEKFELLGCGYSHPIFPLLPIEDTRKQIEFNLDIMEKTLQYRPQGFWLPELAYDPTIPHILKEYGYNYIFIDEELYKLSSPLLNDSNPYNTPFHSVSHYVIDLLKSRNIFQKVSKFSKALRAIKKNCKNSDFIPVELKGAKGTITGLKVPQSWSIMTQASLLGYPFISIRKVIKIMSRFKNSKGLIIPYGTDIEFFGYRDFIKGKSLTEKDLERFLEKMMKIKGNKMILPSKYLEKNKPTEIGYMKTGSWSPDKRLDLWTRDEDNKKLEKLCDEIRWYFRQLSPDEITSEMWKHLLLAENSDGRGWDPIPERRLYCFSHALQALELVKQRFFETKNKKKK